MHETVDYFQEILQSALFLRGKIFADFKIGHNLGVLNLLPDSLYVPQVNVDSMHYHYVI